MKMIMSFFVGREFFILVWNVANIIVSNLAESESSKQKWWSFRFNDVSINLEGIPSKHVWNVTILLFYQCACSQKSKEAGNVAQ